jgi:hypothetical protein
MYFASTLGHSNPEGLGSTFVGVGLGVGVGVGVGECRFVGLLVCYFALS